MGFISRLRNRDDKRTRAAELTLRESIYPLMLVTILFFLWVGLISPVPPLANSHPIAGLLIRSHRHSQQALPGPAGHHAIPLVWSSSSIFRCLPTCFSGPRQLDPAPLGIQGMLHLGPDALRHRCSTCLAMSCVSLIRWLLRCDVRRW